MARTGSDAGGPTVPSGAKAGAVKGVAKTGAPKPAAKGPAKATAKAPAKEPAAAKTKKPAVAKPVAAKSVATPAPKVAAKAPAKAAAKAPAKASSATRSRPAATPAPKAAPASPAKAAGATKSPAGDAAKAKPAVKPAGKAPAKAAADSPAPPKAPARASAGAGTKPGAGGKPGGGDGAKKPTFDPEVLESIRQNLLAHREELERQLLAIEDATANTTQSEMSGEVSFDEDYADAGSITFEREKEMSIANNVTDLRSKIDRALHNIDDGSYGICESCGKPIEGPRLKALPHVTLCLKCKKAEERR